jgi:penicillin V acylase-like amidase (Ntn superfamily)
MIGQHRYILRRAAGFVLNSGASARHSLLAFLAWGLIMAGSGRAEGSGTAFVMRGQGAVLLAKNLDWPVGEGLVLVNKRDVVKEAFGGSRAAALRWTSKYGSVTFNQFGREFPLGGINEMGLVIEELSAQAEYPPPVDQACLNELQWIQYHLDTCRSVKEAMKSAFGLRISKLLFGLHYLIADRKGNAAVVEFNDGQMAVYSGDSLPVAVLSDDRYAESLGYLRLHQGFGGERRASGGTGSSERFVRAAIALAEYRMLGQRPLIDHAFVVLKSVAQEDTQWSVVYNIPRRLVFFKTREHRRYKIIPLDGLDFSCRTPALMLPVTTELAGNLTRNLIPCSPRENQRLLESVFRALREKGELQDIPPGSLVQEMAAYPALCRCRK